MKQSNFSIYSTSKEAWDAMYQAILTAQKSIYWELYIFIDDEVGRPFFDVLEQKAKAGVDVKIIVDGLGSFWLSNDRIKKLKNVGVEIWFFKERKHKYRGWWKQLWTRTHRKILIVDEQIGFIGGVNIRKEMRDWLDVQVRLEGKTVRSLLRVFAKSYLICGGEKEAFRRLLKYKYRVEQDEADFIYDEPHEKRSTVREKYVEALLKARERVILFSPYYAPDKKLLYALWQARKRGVKIDLLIPFRSDHRFMTYLTYASFSLMTRYGVKMHFMKNKMMHGKGIIVDDDWAMIGSSNIEQTSFYNNYEVNLHLRDKKFVKDLKNKLEEWLKDSMELDEKRWAKRGVWHRLNEWLAFKLYKLWYGNK